MTIVIGLRRWAVIASAALVLSAAGGAYVALSPPRPPKPPAPCVEGVEIRNREQSWFNCRHPENRVEAWPYGDRILVKCTCPRTRQ